MSTYQDEPKKIAASVSIQQDKPFDFLRILFGMVYY